MSDIKPDIESAKFEITRLENENQQLNQRIEQLEKSNTHEALRVMLQKANAKIEQLERERDEAHGWIARAMMKGCCNEDITKEALQKIIDQRDIEQQVKTINALKEYIRNKGLEWHVLAIDMFLDEQLRKGGE